MVGSGSHSGFFEKRLALESADSRFDAEVDQDDLLCPDAPSALQVEITSQCNLRCRMCPLTTGGSSSAISAGHMSDVVWSELLPLARHAKKVFVTGFGEPLTNPRCLDLLQQLNDEGIRTSISTNGLALNPATARRLASLPFLVHINVSIDSPDATSYRKIRGGNLSRAFRGLENLVEAMPDTSRITVSSIAMRENLETLAQFPPLLAGLGIKTYMVQGLNDYNDFSKSESLVGSRHLLEHLGRLRSACDQAGVELVLTTPERTMAEEHDLKDVLAQYYEVSADTTVRTDQTHQTRQCMVPWDQPYIDKDGRVFPCCVAGASGQSQLGRLGQSDQVTLSDIWVGEAYREFRNALLGPGTTPAVCRSCTIVPVGPHPLRVFSASLLGPARLLTANGEVALRVRNTGTHPWDTGSVRVATTMPRDRPSAVEHRTWISGNRPCSFTERVVGPGQVATFAFQVTLPPKRATEEFQLVAEHIAWLPNTRFTVVTPTLMHRPLRTLRWMAGRSRWALRRKRDVILSRAWAQRVQ
jgi:MoaA/NifB/PqqE/SkfB family radical SAM enzyme